MKIVELFAGIGGFSKPAKELDMSVDGVYEWDTHAINIYNECFDTNIKPTDITKVKPDDFPDMNLLIAGAPCQAWSICGHRRGFEDARGTLWYDVFRIMDAKKPKYVLIENVPGLLSHNDGKSFELILTEICALGYAVDFRLLNTKNFGIPQNRLRVFILAIRKEYLTENELI